MYTYKRHGKKLKLANTITRIDFTLLNGAIFDSTYVIVNFNNAIFTGNDYLY